MAKMSNYLENALINAILRNTPFTSPETVYVALYTSDPTDADTGAEVAEASYARQAATFGAPANGVSTNSVAITFPVALTNWGTVTHIGIRDAAAAGNLLFHGALDVSKVVNTDNQLVFNIGQLSVTLE